MQCPHCHASNTPDVDFCTACGSSMAAPPSEEPPINATPPIPPAAPPTEAEKQRKRYITIGLIVVLCLLAIGSLHIVSSSEAGISIVPKVSFSFAETFVSLDAITGMPFIAAKMKYPLAIKALQRNGMLETDEAFQRRIEEETRQQMERAEEEARKQMERAEEETRKQMEKIERQSAEEMERLMRNINSQY